MSGKCGWDHKGHAQPHYSGITDKKPCPANAAGTTEDTHSRIIVVSPIKKPNRPTRRDHRGPHSTHYGGTARKPNRPASRDHRGPHSTHCSGYTARSKSIRAQEKKNTYAPTGPPGRTRRTPNGRPHLTTHATLATPTATDTHGATSIEPSHRATAGRSER